jgi:hypothetical protein
MGKPYFVHEKDALQFLKDAILAPKDRSSARRCSKPL